MSKKTLSARAISVLALVTIAMMLGCNEQKDEMSSYSPTTTDVSPANADRGQEYQLVILENGMEVTVVSVDHFPHFSSATVILDRDGSLIERVLRFTLDGHRVELLAGDHSEVLYTSFGDVALDGSAVTFTQIAAPDTLRVEYRESGLARKYRLNDDSLVLSFDSQENVDHALWLCEEFNELTIQSRPPLDQELYYRMDSLGQFLSAPCAFEGNPDVELAGQLMAAPEFVNELVPDNPSLMWWDKLCGVSSLVATATCWCAWSGWCAVACIPASGVSLTCAILGIIGVDVD